MKKTKFPPKLTGLQLHGLITKHIARYSDMLQRAKKGAGIRADECQDLLLIWGAIQLKGGSLDPAVYTEREIDEITDAWFDEYDYNEFDQLAEDKDAP